ncbi:hypothetical protein [Peribacillus frigoritolerans]|uniref:hypothetical protein n=1 Tax=Peribacillus frigoritolerans TaxID=450367 RepID=UPI00105A2ECA|nr:hypothetical protein [Peribacillus frigoritolerans]TDL74246.1 hypothetical protein E2R53_22845 [Peribacillus frigoritolerans]
MSFKPEFIKRLAMGDDVAYEEIKGLPLLERMAIGNAVDELKRKENIVPVDGGKMSIYDQPKSSYFDNEEVGKALAERIQREKEQAQLKEKIRQEQLEKEIKQKVERARAGLTY